MPGAAYTLLQVDEATAQPERVSTYTDNRRDLSGAGQGRGGAHDGEHGSHQLIVAPGSLDAPLARALKQNAVDVVLSANEQAIAQLPAASLANRARRRVIAASWRAWPSSGVDTVT